MSLLKPLIIDNKSLQRLKDINDIEEFIDFISPYYPNLNIKEYTIEEIEQSLYQIYFMLIGKILQYSPPNMRSILRDYLLKYEIINIKQIILKTILGKSIKEKKKNVNYLIEEYLENTDFIEDLIKIPSLDEIQLFMKHTRYNKAVREGILYFKKNNEIFVLESFLDQLYYINLIRKKDTFNKKENTMFNLFVNYESEIYNLNIIYRGIKNKIDKKLLTQFLVKNYLFLNAYSIDYLLYLDNVKDFISIIYNYFNKNNEINSFFRIFGLNKKHFIISIEKLFQKYYFKKFQVKIDDIDFLTIYKILELVIKKENEIRLIIIPKVVKITQEKFRNLKSHIGI